MLTTPDIAKRQEKRIEEGDELATRQRAGASVHLELGENTLLTAGTASRRGIEEGDELATRQRAGASVHLELGENTLLTAGTVPPRDAAQFNCHSVNFPDMSVTAYMEPFHVRLNGATSCSPYSARAGQRRACW